jgi:hypothetical protein
MIVEELRPIYDLYQQCRTESLKRGEMRRKGDQPSWYAARSPDSFQCLLILIQSHIYEPLILL